MKLYLGVMQDALGFGVALAIIGWGFMYIGVPPRDGAQAASSASIHPLPSVPVLSRHEEAPNG